MLAHLPRFVDRLFAKAGLTRDQIDWIVPHQASLLALRHLTRRLGFQSDRVVDIFAEFGNQVAASLPTALDVAVRNGRIQRGLWSTSQPPVFTLSSETRPAAGRTTPFPAR